MPRSDSDSGRDVWRDSGRLLGPTIRPTGWSSPRSSLLRKVPEYAEHPGATTDVEHVYRTRAGERPDIGAALLHSRGAAALRSNESISSKCRSSQPGMSIAPILA